jgi:hypothetical protein
MSNDRLAELWSDWGADDPDVDEDDEVLEILKALKAERAAFTKYRDLCAAIDNENARSLYKEAIPL